eukprot:4665068-Amphidinium_carterae.1
MGSDAKPAELQQYISDEEWQQFQREFHFSTTLSRQLPPLILLFGLATMIHISAFTLCAFFMVCFSCPLACACQTLWNQRLLCRKGAHSGVLRGRACFLLIDWPFWRPYVVMRYYVDRSEPANVPATECSRSAGEGRCAERPSWYLAPKMPVD